MTKVPFFAVVLDESAAIDNVEYLCVELQYWLPGKGLRMKFLKLHAARFCDADNLHKYVLTVLQDIAGLDGVELQSRLVGFGSDGASVMKCLAKNMTTQDAPFLTWTHCAGHRVQLVASELQGNELFNKVEHFCRLLHNHFTRSAKRTARLEEICKDVGIEPRQVLAVE